MKPIRINVLAMAPKVRWWAAEFVASLMPRIGVTSAAGVCPHCGFRIHYVHDNGAADWPETNWGCVYECVRCGATHLLVDHHEWLPP